MNNNKEEYKTKKCVICNKTFDYDYDLFGRTCLKNLYEQLSISNPTFTSNKEAHLCNKIAHRNHKYFLGKEKKYALTENYIALDYLERMNLKQTENIKEKIQDNIKNISTFKPLEKSMLLMYPLNKFYKLYNNYLNFQELLNKIDISKGVNDNNILSSFSFIFNKEKINDPLYYWGYYGMQLIFWEMIIKGGELYNYKLSAYLLRKALTNSGKHYNDKNKIIFEDEKLSKILLENKDFKQKINELLINDEVDIKEENPVFEKGDLFYSIHEATLDLKGTKTENGNWNLTIVIKDKYDFTDFKTINEYETKSIKDIFGSTLNNFGAISSEYKVIKPYVFEIRIKKNNYKIK